MRSGKYLAALAAASLSVAPAVAAPTNPAQSLSIAPVGGAAGVRSASATTDQSDLLGGGVIAAVIVAAGIIAAIVIITVSDNSPDSP